jgi:Na+/H+ antiporter NhaD/arsenite permease-like protein
MSEAHHHNSARPIEWGGCAIAAIIAGALVNILAPVPSGTPTPLWLCTPFAALLLAIAVMPLIASKFFHAHYASISFALGGLILGYYLRTMIATSGGGGADILHAAVEYYQFIALVGGLYIASGGILINIRARATPLRNTLLLAFGAAIANVLGTTGASVLLIRPYMRMNRARLRPLHVVMFIFIVSNCGGCLTPIGDPPLYLGFLKGVPFWWNLTHMWPMWLLVNGLLLAIFFVADSRIPGAPPDAPEPDPDRFPLIAGVPAIVCLLLLVAGVFIDPALEHLHSPILNHIPIGATFQLVMAVVAYRLSRPAIRAANQFSFEPAKEVAILFAGIFLTMVPALSYLRTHADSLGLESPSQYYFLTGGLSAALDNAPTYLSFLQTAMGASDLPMNASGIERFIALHGQILLEAIALGAVFFGAMTYIGNGPNFMVRSIVESAHAAANRPNAPTAQLGLGTRTPSFGGYLVYALAILLPVLVLNWLIFIR